MNAFKGGDTTHLTTNQLCYLNIITTTDNFPFLYSWFLPRSFFLDIISFTQYWTEVNLLSRQLIAPLKVI